MSTAEDTWVLTGRQVGRYAASILKPIIWGLLVGGTGLAVLPGGPSLVVIVAVALVLGFVKPPRGELLAEQSERSKIVRLAGVTIVAVATAFAGVAPSAFLAGAVFHLGFKTIRARALNVAAVVVALVALAGTGSFIDPAVLLTSGDAWSAGSASRDLIRFVLLLMLAAGLSDDQRRATEVAAARETAVADERARIARELHDVVAHHVSAMTIQAEAARSALRSSITATNVDRALEAAASSGRTALGELRRLLGVLRAPSTGADLGPQPTLDDLGDLVASASTGGLDVRLDRRGEPVTAVSPAVALSTYRIVQEALANVAKHARADTVVVTLSTPDSENVDGGAIIIEVRDDGRGANGRSGPGTGFGILGMRERASLVGGTIEAGPGPDGNGWHVRAVLPLDTVPA